MTRATPDNATPTNCPPSSGRAGSGTIEGDELQFHWDELVPHFVHPLKVAIIEAMLWIDRPISASELARVFLEEFDLSLVSYHLNKLAATGALEQVGERQVRGALQRFYFFPER
jgi:hypothetical protein